MTFFVHGDPKAQPRARAFAWMGSGGKIMVRAYDPGTAEGWKAQIAMSARPHIPLKPIEEPVSVNLLFWFRRPKAHFKGKSKELRTDAPTAHCTKPDCDNLAKAVLDALTALGMWRDDKQVYSICVSKHYAADTVGCTVHVETGGE
jgi:Holliday junction resolvase RusA-like endonuclease